MGIHAQLARALIAARARGASFERTLTLGRLRLYARPKEIASFLREYGIAGDVDSLEDAQYAEPFFRLLGATQVDSLDASDFEGATLLHDLNTPVPAEWHGRYDFVLDGGTLEHVFFYPTALKSAMELTRVGGTMFLCTPAANFSGHGFYTFSPELFYSALSDENGYVIERMILCEYHPRSRWYQVQDPRRVKRRVSFVSDGHQAHLMVHATRIAKSEIFARAPQQSDYEAAWREGTVEEQRSKGSGARAFLSELNRDLKSTGFMRRRHNLRRWSIAAQPDLFTPIDR